MSKKGYEIGSRNVFKDFGVLNAEKHFVKGAACLKDRHAHERAKLEAN
jgi:hypothetical protein